MALTETGEHGPELLVPAGHKGRTVLITHPMLLELGRRGRDIVLPLQDGSAPYHGGPMKREPRPTTPAPRDPKIKPEAKAALSGRGPQHSPGPGANALSPKTAPVVKDALVKHGLAKAAKGMVSTHIVGRMEPGDKFPRLSPRLMPHMDAGGLSGLTGSLFGYGPGTGTNNAAGQLNAQGVAGPAQLSTGEEEQNAASQAETLRQLQGEAAGTGPSAAGAVLSQGTAAGIAAQGAGAAGGRYGGNAQTRQTQVANTAANLEGGAANQGAQISAQERQAGAQGAAALGTSMRGQALQAAAANMQGEEMYNQQLAGLYGQEQGQQAAAGMGLQNTVLQGMSGALGLGSMAHGGVVDGMEDGGIDLGPVAGFTPTSPPAPAQSKSSGGGLAQLASLAAAKGAVVGKKFHPDAIRLIRVRRAQMHAVRSAHAA